MLKFSTVKLLRASTTAWIYSSEPRLAQVRWVPAAVGRYGAFSRLSARITLVPLKSPSMSRSAPLQGVVPPGFVT